MSYRRMLNQPNVLVTQKADDRQVLNNAGGYTFEASKWEQLDRFLLIGSEGGTYYVDAQTLTTVNLKAVKACLAEDGKKTVARIVELSQSGRALKNDPSIIALAVALHTGNEATMNAAKAGVSKVCRTGTDILHLASYLDELHGWGRAKRTAIANWYSGQSAESLAFQVAKYQNRDGWTHRDLMRLAHIKPADDQHQQVMQWVLKGWERLSDTPPDAVWLKIIWAMEQGKKLDKGGSAADMIKLIVEYRLPREMIPTRFLSMPEVQIAQLPSLGYKAMIRNLGNFSKSGAMDRMKADIVTRLTNQPNIKGSRVHPIDILLAMKQYGEGHGFRGTSSWNVEGDVIDALMDAFHAAFTNVTPTNKKILVAVDTSGSMHTPVHGAVNMSATEACAALAIVIHASEPHADLAQFDDNAKMVTGVTKRTHLKDAIGYFNSSGGTNISSVVALAGQRLSSHGAYDAIVILTDSESWHGSHTHLAMQQYRRVANRATKLIIIASAANVVTVIDPADENSLAIAGFDGTVPQVISNFIG